MRVFYHLARYQAGFVREIYGRALPLVVRSPLRSRAQLPVHVVTFSSARDLPEQVASLRSFLRYVGSPLSITVTSDGSHHERDRAVLRRIDPIVRVLDYDEFARPDLPAKVLRYAEVHPMGRKLMVIASLRAVPTIYLDSDILFFPPAGTDQTREVLSARQTMYLQQGWSVGYDRAVLPDAEGEAVNAGFLIVASPLDWSEAWARMPEHASAADLYLEQTLVHIAMRKAAAKALPPHEWALHGHDQFHYRDAQSLRTTVLRHYVSVTRHKFWLALSRSSMLFAPRGRLQAVWPHEPQSKGAR
jgi:hypothetical protein